MTEQDNSTPENKTAEYLQRLDQYIDNHEGELGEGKAKDIRRVIRKDKPRSEQELENWIWAIDFHINVVRKPY